jgi:hypothetical protein
MLTTRPGVHCTFKISCLIALRCFLTKKGRDGPYHRRNGSSRCVWCLLRRLHRRAIAHCRPCSRRARPALPPQLHSPVLPAEPVDVPVFVPVALALGSAFNSNALLLHVYNARFPCYVSCFTPRPLQPQQQYDENCERVALRRRCPEDDQWVGMPTSKTHTFIFASKVQRLNKALSEP